MVNQAFMGRFFEQGIWAQTVNILEIYTAGKKNFYCLRCLVPDNHLRAKFNWEYAFVIVCKGLYIVRIQASAAMIRLQFLILRRKT